MPGPFIDWSDDELRASIRAKGERIDPAYNDLLRELERRAAERQARWSRVLSVVSVLIAVAAIVVSALR